MTRRLSTFRVDGQLYGIDVDAVQEVTRSLEPTPVPRAGAAVHGLVNLRGQVVTVIDLRHRLGCAARGGNEAAYNVVLSGDGGLVALLVDAVEGFEDVNDDAYTSRPTTVTGPATEIVPGAYQLEDELLLTIDVSRAMDLEFA